MTEDKPPLPSLVDVRKIGRLGGLARVANQTPEQRRRLARKAVRARWKKYRAEQVKAS